MKFFMLLVLLMVIGCAPAQQVEPVVAPQQPAPVLPESIVSTPEPLENASPLVPPSQPPLDLADNLDESIKDLQYST
ncbi:MAG: hypothetical protein AABY13_00165 [Nanoarchaeota archaeon]